ncbi:L-seryl-tRNA(Sec) selenium transferase [Planktotalea sp.]|uniref:L-seryl-tRNA(Sec) selenium transferase n=1 Tax=Planktotalea sp. TaxID=2029877 RepID=UPI003F6BEBEE
MIKTLRDIPQIQTLLDQPLIKALQAEHGHAQIVDALRQITVTARRDLRDNLDANLPPFDSRQFSEIVEETIKTANAPSLKTVINATGILIHTNLGRACLAPEAVAAMQAVADAPSNLEFDLKTGKRGSRHAHVEALICALTGAQAAVVVNNCAAAVLLSLMATAAGRNVVASRGELIEIGGSFRLPDVIAQSGAALREVGATNKTRARDYAEAIDEDTAVLLKSHTSNFKIIGFTAAPNRRDLARLAQENNVILMEDLGSGVLIDLAPYGLVDEPVVTDILKAGVDLVMFSGDKLLGGPQAGIIAGRADIINDLKSHPLMRAVRIDKLSLAALEATLRLYRPPYDPTQKIPVLRMVSEPLEAVQKRAERLAQDFKHLGLEDVEVFQSTCQVGAGTLPGQGLASFAVSIALQGMSPDQLAAKLRQSETPVIGRIKNDRSIFDVRGLSDTDVLGISAAVSAILKQ